MKKPRIVILRGPPTSGKSTAFATLKKRKELKDWILIDHPEIKNWFNYLPDRRELGKKTLFAVLKESMKTKRNIILEEMSRDTLDKNIGKTIKKYGYRYVVFQFTVRIISAYKRDIIRSKTSKRSKMGKKWVDELNKMHDERFDKTAIVIDTNKLSKKAVIDLILKELT